MELMNFKLDKTIFEQSLKKAVHNNQVNILDVKNDTINTKGVNFLSDTYFVSVRYMIDSKDADVRAERSMNVVIKSVPTNAKSAENIVEEQDLFATELQMLRDVLPMIEEFVSRQIGPTLWYGSEGQKVLIMENLSIKGYVMKDRQKGLSMDHCILVMEQIAKLHAGSVAVFEKDPKLIESFNGGIVSPKCPASFIRLMEVSLLRLSETIAKWSDEKCAQTVHKFNKLAETIGSGCTDVYNYQPDEFCVLNHGDCWINNMLFKEDKRGKPSDVLFVDYQMSVYTSPAIDLLYFLNTCPEINIKYDMDDFFLQVYLNHLKTTMEYIGCKTKPPTMQELKRAIYKRRIYAVFSGIVLHLRMIANSEDTEDFDEVLGNLRGETKMDVFKNPDAIEFARKMIPVLDERGYLD